jgi:ubiquitin carboxyl-terminal hydrolase 5/13
MNIKMVEKEKGEKKPVQITKLAIGKPGGIDPDVDDYDTIVTVKCLNCNKELDNRQPMLAGLVDSVLLSQSAYFSQTIQEWELKLEPCEHTLTLDQTGAQKIAAMNLAHCGECELSANLWLCMTCGHLGCGRKNYDGSGGNEHAVNHFDQTAHPLVCKLGTITPEGKASIYCYACNDDKNDDELV